MLGVRGWEQRAESAVADDMMSGRGSRRNAYAVE